MGADLVAVDEPELGMRGMWVFVVEVECARDSGKGTGALSSEPG